MDSTATSFKILLVEDNLADIRFVQEALKESITKSILFVVRTGQVALDYLHQHSDKGDPNRPDIILLDLNLPSLNGRQVLAKIKADETMRTIPTIVLTSSAAENDVMISYRMQANSYIIKPIDFDKLVTIIQQIESFWFLTAKLP